MPLNLRTPLQGFFSQNSRQPLGIPFASYRSTVGAALASWALGMTPTQDLVSLVAAAVRDLRSLGPPTHCWQRNVVQEMLADVAVRCVTRIFFLYNIFFTAINISHDLVAFAL